MGVIVGPGWMSETSAGAIPKRGPGILVEDKFEKDNEVSGNASFVENVPIEIARNDVCKTFQRLTAEVPDDIRSVDAAIHGAATRLLARARHGLLLLGRPQRVRSAVKGL